MKAVMSWFCSGCFVLLSMSAGLVAEEEARLAELDAYWAEVSRAVGEGDFEAYVATCQKEAVYVNGISKQCYPLAQALARWKKEFVATKAGTRKSSVEFRFAERLGGEKTAHETGIFLYSFQLEGEERKKEYVHLEALLVKEKGGWKIVMEYQKALATEGEWEALK